MLVVDLNNLIKEGEKHEWHNPFSEVLFKTSDNEFQTRTKKVMSGELTLSHFKSNTISSEEKEGVAQQLKKYIDSKQEDYDYILIKTVPLLVPSTVGLCEIRGRFQEPEANGKPDGQYYTLQFLKSRRGIVCFCSSNLGLKICQAVPI